MKRLIAISMMMLVGMLGVACSDDDGGSGGVCEDSFNKQKTCAEGLDCSALTGAEKMGCELTKGLYSGLSYSQFKAACEQQTPGECECEGDAKTAAEKLNACTLDPKTCACPTTTQEDGGGTTPDAGGTTPDAGGMTPDA